MDKELKEFIASQKLDDKKILDILKKSAELKPADSDESDEEEEEEGSEEQPEQKEADKKKKNLSIDDLQKMIDKAVSDAFKKNNKRQKPSADSTTVQQFDGKTFTVGGFGLLPTK